MNKEALLNLLDIENGSEFTYYENIAELLEAEQEIGADAIFQVLEEADLSIFAEIVESYFYDIMEKMPDNDVDLYNIFEAVKRNFIALSEAADRNKDSSVGEDFSDGNVLLRLSEELDEFHKYYSLTENCLVIDRESGIREEKSLRDAISDNRLALMDNRQLDFNLEEAKNFTVDEYMVGIKDLFDDEEY